MTGFEPRISGIALPTEPQPLLNGFKFTEAKKTCYNRSIANVEPKAITNVK